MRMTNGGRLLLFSIAVILLIGISGVMLVNRETRPSKREYQWIPQTHDISIPSDTTVAEIEGKEFEKPMNAPTATPEQSLSTEQRLGVVGVTPARTDEREEPRRFHPVPTVTSEPIVLGVVDGEWILREMHASEGSDEAKRELIRQLQEACSRVGSTHGLKAIVDSSGETSFQLPFVLHQGVVLDLTADVLSEMEGRVVDRGE